MTPDPARDAFETALYRTAREVGVPVLGICRGLQIITIAEGGRLHRHLPEDVPAHPTTGLAPTAVDVEIDAASDLALALGTSARVTAFHHQGCGPSRGSARRRASRQRAPLAVEAASGSTVLGCSGTPRSTEPTGPGLREPAHGDRAPRRDDRPGWSKMGPTAVPGAGRSDRRCR